MKMKSRNNRDDLRPEYDFYYSKAVRGKYYKKLLHEGANVVVLEPDVTKAFGDSATVNEALRSLLDFSRSPLHLTKRSAAKKKKKHHAQRHHSVTLHASKIQTDLDIYCLDGVYRRALQYRSQ